MKKYLLVLMLSPLFVFAQSDSTATESTSLTKKEIRKARPHYFEIAFGSDASKFRDFATSPLTYKGRTKLFTVSYLRYDENRESNFYVKYNFGNYSIDNEKDPATASVKTVFVGYSRLYKLNKWSNEKWNYKVGGIFDLTGNMRDNPALQNNSFGAEFFNTLFVSGKVTRDLSRKVNKDKKFLFIKYKRKPRKLWLSYRLNVSLMNNTFRNGYIYSNSSSTINHATIFSGYEMKFFSGFRMSAALDHTIEIKNGSQLRLSYLWDAYTTGGDYDTFVMAHHVLQASLLFNF